MKFGYSTFRLFALPLLLAACSPCAFSQALYTATQTMSLSAWGGATGTFVNLPTSTSTTAIPVVGTPGSPVTFDTLSNGGRNLGITAGVDLRVWEFHGLLPSIEIRGTFPFAKGQIAGEENAFVGLKVEHIFGRYHLYGDFLFGRGEMQYQGRGYLSPNQQYLYLQSFSNVLSPGVGVDIDVTHHFAAKLDAQLWHQGVPVTTSGTLNSLAFTAGVIYRFDFNKRLQIPKVPKAPRAAPANAAPPPANTPPPAPASTSP